MGFWWTIKAMGLAYTVATLGMGIWWAAAMFGGVALICDSEERRHGE